jgi:polyisoprenoid-binding protein YceI
VANVTAKPLAWTLVPPAAALGLGLARWLAQDSGNVYTDVGRRFYVPDPDLGWRQLETGALWLGLEALGALAAAAVAVGLGSWLIRRRERRRGRVWRPARVALWAVAIAPMALPVAAFASGTRPDGARDRLPEEMVTAPAEGITGSLAGLPAGTYRVLDHEGSRVVGKVVAGGEAFDALFPEVTGFWQGDPGDLTAPMRARVQAAVAPVETGVTMRDKHVREDYLLGAQHPQLEFELEAIEAAEQRGPDELAFRARGRVHLVGREHEVPLIGTMRALDAAARDRLGIEAAAALLIDTQTSLTIADTVLAPDAGDFDRNEIPIIVGIVLVHTPNQGPDS